MNSHKKRLLIIDDSEAIHQDFRRILCQESKASSDELDQLEEEIFGTAGAGSPEDQATFEVDSAFQGQEGVAKVKQAQAAGLPYQLVFVDYRMPPGWNGVETLRRLREVAPSLQVVLCSAYSDYSWEEIIHEFGEARSLLELRKPFNSQELRALAVRLTHAQP